MQVKCSKKSVMSENNQLADKRVLSYSDFGLATAMLSIPSQLVGDCFGHV